MKEVCCLCACGFLLLFSSSISHSFPYLPPPSLSSLSPIPPLLSPPIPPPSLPPSFPPSSPPSVTTPCDVNNGGCSHICVSRPCRNGEGLEVVCMCPVGYPLMRDKRTCQSSEFCVCVCGGGGGVYVHVHGKLSNKTPPHGHVPVSTNALFF